MGDLVSTTVGRLTADRWLLVSMAVIILILSIAVALVLLFQDPKDDVLNFYRQAMYMKNGLLPYTDFDFEFPPFALFFFYIPGMFTSNLETYACLFAVECILFQIAASYCILRLAATSRGVSRYVAATVFVALMLIYLPESVNKFDGIVMSLTIISLYLFSRGHWVCAYALMSVATLTKLYPGFLILLMMGYNIISGSGGLKAVRAGLVSSVAVTALAFGTLALAGVPFSDMMSFLTFHDSRGFQVESMMGTIIQSLGFLGITDVGIVPANYTYDLTGPLAEALSPYWTYVCMAVVLATILFAFHRMKGARDAGSLDIYDLAAAMLITCMAFMLFNKVFSTQYTMWIFPFIAMLCYADRRMDPRIEILIMLSLFMEIFSVLILVHGIGSVEYVATCGIRDIMLIVIGALVCFGIGRSWYRDQSSASAL